MSRSCHRATFSSPTSAFARTTRASPQIRSAVIGFRLCGIADEPFWPRRERLLDLPHLGAGEVADLGREPVERRGDEGERRQKLRVTVALEDLRRARRRVEPEPLAGDALDLRVDRRVLCPRRPRASRRASRRAPARAASGRGRARTPSPRASARTSWARRARRASGPCTASRDAPPRASTTARNARSSPSSTSAPASCTVSESAVSSTSDDVSPKWNQRPSLAERLGDRVDERGNVVVGLAFELGHPRGGRRHGIRRGSARRCRRGTTPTAAQPSSAASSTSSIRVSLASSDQIRAMAGRA